MSSKQTLGSRSELAHTRTSNDSIMITRIGSVAYGSTRKEQLQGLNPIHYQGLKTDVGVLCICRMKNTAMDH
jgi:hypothetical protein